MCCWSASFPTSSSQGPPGTKHHVRVYCCFPFFAQLELLILQWAARQLFPLWRLASHVSNKMWLVEIQDSVLPCLFLEYMEVSIHWTKWEDQCLGGFRKSEQDLKAASHEWSGNSFCYMTRSLSSTGLQCKFSEPESSCCELNLCQPKTNSSLHFLLGWVERETYY